MREPKAISLYKLLNNNELDDLMERLVGDNRTRLVDLVEVLSNFKNQTYTKEIRLSLFTKLFEMAYSKDKDYLLRNEFRLLSTYVEDVLIDAEIAENLNKNLNLKNYFYLLALQGKNALDLFDKEYKNAYQLAVDHADYFAAHSIAGLNFYNQSQLVHLKEKDIPFVNKLNDSQLTNLSSYYLAAFRTHQINGELTRNFTYPFSIHERKLVKDIAVDFSKYENDYSGYLYLKAKSFLVSHEEKIEILKECLVFLEKRKGEGPIFTEELKFCYQSLANSYSLLFKFDDAMNYFNRFFELPIQTEDPQRLNVICDYITKLIKLDKVEEAIKWIEDNSKMIASVEKLKIRIHALEISCYAFTGQVKKLNSLLPKKMSDYNLTFKNFYKFYFSISAYLEGRIEDAYRENQNFIKAVSNQKLDFDVKDILKFFNRFYNLTSTYSTKDPKYKSYLTKLEKEIQAYSSTALPEFRAYLPFIWLRRELNKELRMVAV